eukprot:CAMPEP_0119378418 /NCGR_PEP_ID=MMETSP1334-20130426/48227_1 /TAXON_ID=127549 /ORGANISM="Calcidiscus leptoporus, Strain RCC1130" /LENGTH=145 /DNA_ID=CAMNT_0007397617 /DNA_START=460 /DNA_END=895 /DNA_ORIENTATION=+
MTQSLTNEEVAPGGSARGEDPRGAALIAPHARAQHVPLHSSRPLCAALSLVEWGLKSLRPMGLGWVQGVSAGDGWSSAALGAAGGGGAAPIFSTCERDKTLSPFFFRRECEGVDRSSSATRPARLAPTTGGPSRDSCTSWSAAPH